MNDALPRRERSSLTGFAINRLDRREDLRNKPDAVTALRHRSDTRIAVVAGETPILKRLDGEALTVWFSHGEAEILGPAAEEIFMGMTEDGTPRFGRLLDKALAEPLKERSELFVTDLRSTGENAPSHRVFVGRIEIGAAWSKQSNEGRDYLGLKLDDPSFTAPLYANLVEDEDGKSFSLIWSRPNRRSGD